MPISLEDYAKGLSNKQETTRQTAGLAGPSQRSTAPTWDQILNSAKFQSHDDATKEAVRQRYFSDFVAPNVPSDKLNAAKASFDSYTKDSWQSPSLPDYGKQFAASGIEAIGTIPQMIGEGAAYIANKVTGSEDYAGFNPLEPVASSIRGTMTPGGKRAAADAAKGDVFKPETIEMPKTKSGLAMSAVQGLGSLATWLIPGALSLKAAKLYKAGDIAAANVAAKNATIAGGVTGGLSTGGDAAGDARQNVESEISNMSHEQLMAEVPVYADSFRQYGDERQARNAVINRAGIYAGMLASGVGAAEGLVGGKLLGGLATRKGIPGIKDIPSTTGMVFAGSVAGSTIEGAQETAEKSAANVGENIALGRPLTHDMTRNTFPEALGGAMVGGGVGGAGGAAGRQKAAPAPKTQPKTPPEAEDSPKNTEQDDLIDEVSKMVNEDVKKDTSEKETIEPPAKPSSSLPDIVGGPSTQEELLSKTHRAAVDADYEKALELRNKQKEKEIEAAYQQSKQAADENKDRLIEQKIREGHALEQAPTAMQLAFQKAREKATPPKQAVSKPVVNDTQSPPQEPAFVPTHELSDGTKVVRYKEDGVARAGVWQDELGDVIEDNHAVPIEPVKASKKIEPLNVGVQKEGPVVQPPEAPKPPAENLAKGLAKGQEQPLVFSESGNPFKTIDEAVLFAKKSGLDDHAPVMNPGGGFALRKKLVHPKPYNKPAAVVESGPEPKESNAITTKEQEQEHEQPLKTITEAEAEHLFGKNSKKEPKENTILRKNGEPFKTENEAIFAIKAKKLTDHIPVKVKGGWGIEPRDDVGIQHQHTITRDSIAKAYSDALAEKAGNFVQESPRKMHYDFADAVINKDGYSLEYLTNGLNETGKAVFSKVTGVKLPKQHGKAWEAIRDWAGITPEQDEAKRSADRDKHINESAKRKFEWLANSAEQVKMAGGGNGKEWVENAVANGFDRLESRKTGAKTDYWLKNADGNGYNLTKKGQGSAPLWKYAKAYLERRALAANGNKEAHDVKEENLETPSGKAKEAIQDAHDSVAAESVAAEEKADDAVHVEPNNAKEPATEDVIAESMQESSDNTVKTLRDSFNWLIKEIDRAILLAPSREEKFGTVDIPGFGKAENSKTAISKIIERVEAKKNARKNYYTLQMLRNLREDAKESRDVFGYKTFDVPGDGKFRVINSKENLESFKKKVLSSKKDGWPKTSVAAKAKEELSDKARTDTGDHGPAETESSIGQTINADNAVQKTGDDNVEAEVKKAKKALRDAGVTGQEMRDAIKDVRKGDLTAEEVVESVAENQEPSPVQAQKEKNNNVSPDEQSKAAEQATAETSSAVQAKTGPYTLAEHSDLMGRLYKGEATVEEYRSAFDRMKASKESLTAEFAKMKKDDIIKFARLGYTYKNDPKDKIVRAAVSEIAYDFDLRDTKSFFMGQYDSTLARLVADTTQQTLQGYADRKKAKASEFAAERKAVSDGIKDPKTIEDFRNYIYVKQDEGMNFTQARMTLTPEQRAKYDELVATDTRGRRADNKEAERNKVSAAGVTTGAKIIETKHTRDGHDLFVVQAEERVDRAVYQQWLDAARKLGGRYSSFRGNGAVPGFQFKTRDAAEAFQKYVSGGDTAAVQEQAQARRDAFEDDRSQSAVERLNEMADRLDEQADTSLGMERNANTARRARFAAKAEAEANSQKAMAETMRNIAAAIESGRAKFLDRVRQKVQVELLQGFVYTAHGDMLRNKYPHYSDREQHKGEKPTTETADYVTWPAYTAFRSDLARLGRALLDVSETKKIGQRIMNVADDVTEAYMKFAKENVGKVLSFRKSDGGIAAFKTKAEAEEAISRSGFRGNAIVLPLKRGENLIILSPSEAHKRGIWDGDSDKRITLSDELGAEIVEKLGKINRRNSASRGIEAPWQFESAYNKRKRLKAMGIETPAELRTALREFIDLREAPKEADKIKELERSMVGRSNDGLDFFPTPSSVADEMIEAAGIQEGMSVLEPSAGMGHIAERIRDAGVDPDVIEISSGRRELLDAKGFNVVGEDFIGFYGRKESKPIGDNEKTTLNTLAKKIKDATDKLERLHPTFGVEYRHETRARATTRSANAGKWAEIRNAYKKELSKEIRILLSDGYDIPSEYKDAAGSGFEYNEQGKYDPIKNTDAEKYDRIIMNPPFSDRRDAEHVRHAYKLLKPGGRLVAIMGEGVFFGSDRKAVDFRSWLESVGGTDEKLDEGTFLDPSLPVTTGVNARMVVIDKSQASEETDKGVAMFSFAGERSAISDKMALSTAKERINNGENAETVRQETGWHEGVDGKWRYEIDDSNANLKRPWPKKGQLFGDIYKNITEWSGKFNPVTVGDIIEHPALFAAYPALMDVSIETKHAAGASLSLGHGINPWTIYIGEGTPMSDVKSVLLHELQHGIQIMEGFALGGDVRGTDDELHPEALQQVSEWSRMADEASLAGNYEKAKELRDEITNLRRLAGYDRYRRLAGEVEARNTQARSGMTDEQRRNTPPSATADIRERDVIVIFNGKAMENAPTPENAVSGTLKQPPRSEDQSAALRLNMQLRNEFGDKWNDAYYQSELPDSLSGLDEAVKKAFGREIVFVTPTDDRFNIFNGVYIGGNTLFINSASNTGFINIVGHELYHDIERTRPDLIDWFGKKAKAYIQNLPEYQELLNKLVPEEGTKYSEPEAQSELLADFMGDAIADPAFLQTLADDNPSKFKALLNTARLWLAKVANKLRGLSSSRYVSDVEGLRSHLRDVLNAYAEGKSISEVKLERNAKPLFSISKDKQGKGVALYSIAPRFYDLKQQWADAGIKGDITENGDIITLSRIIVPEGERGRGKGTAAMQALVDYADRTGRHIVLSPSSDFGGNKKRLVQFYKRFGFVENKGKNRAFTISESMYRQAAGKALYSVAPRFYSQLAKQIEVAPDRVFSTGKQVASWLQANQSKLGIKKEELHWTGIIDWLNTQGKVNKSDVLAYLDGNGVKVEEVLLGDTSKIKPFTYAESEDGDGFVVLDHNQRSFPNGRVVDGVFEEEWEARNRADILNEELESGDYEDKFGHAVNATKYATYQLPGGEKYRELLLTFPANSDVTDFDPQKVEIRRKRLSVTQGSVTIIYDGEELGSFDDSGDINNNYRRHTEESLIKTARKIYEEGNRDPSGRVYHEGVKTKGTFRSPHFEQPNILAHIRMNDRVDAEGRKTLFIEEVQSDWGQKGKKEGFKDADYDAMIARLEDEKLAIMQEVRGINNALYPFRLNKSNTGTHPENLPLNDPAVKARVERRNSLIDRSNEIDLAFARDNRDNAVTSAPFVTDTDSWTKLALKRVLKYAVDNGYEAVAWTTGAQQSDRYDLSKQVDQVAITKKGDEWVVTAWKDGSRVISKDARTDKELSEIVGKDLAEKAIADGGGKYSGLDLKVGGEGMSTYYNTILPSRMKDVLKQVGVKDVEIGEIVFAMKPRFHANKISGDWRVIDNETNSPYGPMLESESVAERKAEELNAKFKSSHLQQPGIIITDALRKSAAQGMPLFSNSNAVSGKTVADFQPLADRENTRLKNGYKVVVVQSEDDLPNDAQPLYQVAWHGSPHDHDKFDSSKIGTGEGAQAYGYGLYFAGKREVAEYYRKAGHTPNPYILVGGRKIGLQHEIPTGDERIAAFELIDAEGNFAKAKLRIENSYNKPSRALEALRKLQDSGAKFIDDKIKGRLYQVELAPSEDEYLLWDKPLSEQSEKVKAALESEFSGDWNDIKRKGGEWRSLTGEQLYNSFAVERADDKIAGDTAGDKAASEYLHSLGIRGIKYLDGSSRSAGEGSFNYVIFNDSDVSITAKYSKQGAIEGAYIGGKTAYLVADGISSVERAKEVISHELHHMAAEQTIDSEEYQRAIKNILALESAGNKVIKELAAVVNSRQPGLDRTARAKEIMAMAAETGRYKKSPALVKIFADIVRAFKLIARSMGLNLDKMGVNEVFSMMRAGEHSLYRDSAGGSYSKQPPGGPVGMFSRKQSSWTDPEPTKLDDLLYEIQDKHIDTKRAIQAITKYAGELADNFNTYLQEALYHGRAAKRVETFLTDELAPLLAEMNKAGVSQDQLNEYLHARHAEERNRVMRDRNPDREDNTDLSNMSDDKAREILKAADPKMEELAKRVDAILADTRQMMVDYGLEKQSTVDGWAALYDHYVPLKREGFDDSVMGNGTGSGFSVRGSSSKAATGSHLAVDNIFANIVMQRERIIVRGEKNRVALSLFGLVKLNPNKDFWKLDKPAQVTQINPETGLEEVVAGDMADYGVPKIKTLQHDVYRWAVSVKGEQIATFRTKGEALAYIDQESLTGAVAGKLDKPYVKSTVVERVDPNYKGQHNVVMVRINGEDHAIIFNKHNPRALRMAEALKNLDADQLGHILGSFSAVTRYIASMNTQYNPVFGAINLIRDVQAGILNLSSTPIKGKELKVLRETYGALKGIYKDSRAIRKGKHPDSPYSKEWEEFQDVGGQTGFRDMFRTAKDRAAAIEHMLDPAWWQKTKTGKVLTVGGILAKPEQFIFDKVGKHVFQWLSDYNLAMENAVRLAAYKVGKEQGMTKVQAAFMAKNLTVNFNKKGRLATQAGSLYAFFNASVQGTARIAETLGHDAKPGEMIGKTGKAIIMGGVTLGVMQAIGLAMFGFDEDEPKDFIQERNLIIPAPGTEKGYLSIPMPLGFHVFPNIGRILTEMMLYGKPVDKTIDMLLITLGAFNPIGGGGSFAQAITPTAGDPIIALSENKDWTGKAIFREDLNKLNPTPGFDRSKDNSTSLAYYIAYAINLATGGSDYTPGRLSPTPDQIEYLVGQATGGVGRESLKLATTTETLATEGRLPAMYKVPLLGRIVGTADDSSAKRDKFYENIRIINRHEAEVTGRAADSGPQSVREYINDNPEAKLIKYATNVESFVRKLQKKRAEALKNGDNEAARRIGDQIDASMTRFNETIKKASAG